MENISTKSKFLNLSKNPMDNIMANINLAIKENEDLSIAIVAGCMIDTTFEEEADGVKIVIKTRNKISILRNVDGKVISVIEK